MIQPTFAPGERVRVVPRANAEYACERCGRVNGEETAGAVLEGVIATPTFIWCPSCRNIRAFKEGEFPVILGDGERIVAPYTWLERIEDES